MRIAVAQVNPVVGDIAGNTDRIVEAIDQARALGADLVVFPELSVVGYPPKDLLLKQQFVRDNVTAVEHIARHCVDIAAIVGFVQPSEKAEGRLLLNSAALCRDGRIVSRHDKSLLPTYDVFDELRYFEPAREVRLARVGGRNIGLSICEDLWNNRDMIGRRLYHRDPLCELAETGAELFVNIAASPFCLDRPTFRERLFGAQISPHGLPLLFCNQVGGNDELIFDGGSLAFDGQGRVIARAKSFDEDLLIVDLDDPAANRREPRAEGIASVHDALVLGMRDYARKCGFSKAVLGLSGGIDSAVTCALAVAALGSENVTGIAMPSRYSSGHSRDDAAALAANLGVRYCVVPIEPAHHGMEQVLAPLFAGTQPGLAEENVQARIRGNVLMSYSNKFGALLLTTGNKSELATGYCTLYGDMAGGLAVIADVPKMMVYELARHINRSAGRAVIPEGSLTKPPSAELKPDQTDQDTLPPYDVLDRILALYVEQERSYEDIVSAGFDATVVRDVIRRVDTSEYKRKQAAPALRVTSRAFGFGRRMPIAARQTSPTTRAD